MKIIHRIGINADEFQQQTLKNIGIEIPSINVFTTLELEEDSKEYNSILPFIKKWGLFDAVGTEFSNEEINNSKLSALRDCWANGYPMPEINQGYKNTTYDSSNYCKVCGIGLKQKEPFRLKKEPIWGNRQFFMLNWVYDELFVKKTVYKEIFEKFSIAFMPVLLYKKENIIEDVVQLIIPTTTLSLNLNNYSFKDCHDCNRRKFELVTRGFFPIFQKDLEGINLIKSQEYFGTGSNARKYIFLSKDLRDEIKKYKDKISYIPQAL